jgi:outer membrane protein
MLFITNGVFKMLKQIALIALMGMSASAMAGQWQVKVGGSLVSPTGSTNVAGVGKVEADYQYAFTPSVEYFFNDAFSAELLLANPIKHDIKANGVDLAGTSIKQLPPTLTFKYNFVNNSQFTPYVGLGATGFFAFSEKGSVAKVKNTAGVAGQLGVNFKPADAKNWGVFVDVRYADLSPKVRLADADNTEFKLDIDPVVYTLGYSYKF